MAFHPLGNSGHAVVSGFIDFSLTFSIYCLAYDYSCADPDSLRDYLRDVPW